MLRRRRIWSFRNPSTAAEVTGEQSKGESIFFFRFSAGREGEQANSFVGGEGYYSSTAERSSPTPSLVGDLFGLEISWTAPQRPGVFLEEEKKTRALDGWTPWFGSCSWWIRLRLETKLCPAASFSKIKLLITMR